MKTPETLNTLLEKRADNELQGKLNNLFGQIESFAYDGLHSGKMDHVPSSEVSFNGYANPVKESIWPPSIVEAAKSALFAGMRRNYREKFLRSFIEKVEDVNGMSQQ